MNIPELALGKPEQMAVKPDAIGDNRQRRVFLALSLTVVRRAEDIRWGYRLVTVATLALLNGQALPRGLMRFVPSSAGDVVNP